MNVDKKYKVGITFGAFNPLHFGHIRLFRNAKKTCEKLVVCVSSNEYIEKIKNVESLFNEVTRMEDIKSIIYVNEVDVQHINFGKKELVEKWGADVIYVGDDWNKETFSGEGLGVPVVYLPRTPYISSTLLRKNLL